jgi:hypothetical protein
MFYITLFALSTFYFKRYPQPLCVGLLSYLIAIIMRYIVPVILL